MPSDPQANLIDGRLDATGTDGVIEVTNPADGSRVGSVPAMGRDQLDAVLEAAERGARAWRAAGWLARGRVLLDAAALIRAEANDLAALIVAENGKTLAEARGEVGKTGEFFEYYGALGRQPFGELLPDARPGTFAMQVTEPVGIVLLITPWNDPLMTPARKLAPALIAGNAVIIKPATETPLIALRLAELLNEAGLAPGALGTVTGRGSQIVPPLLADRRIRAVSFTGSTAVGLGVQRELAGTGVRVQTEMGGKNALVVLGDADLEVATAMIMAGGFAQTGQRCTATSRLIVDTSIAPELTARVASAIDALVIGPGDRDGVTMGPVVSAAQQADIIARVEAGIAEGAAVVAEQALPAELSAAGAFVAPIVLAVEPTNSLWREEVFGPVISMITVDGVDAAISAVNDSAYGLSSSVITRSLASAMRFVDEVDTGQVSVNQPTSGWDIHHPFGGFKESGSAFKEQGVGALQFYTRVKTAAIRGV
jgi:aldehyde dehydrogenase (NAD+)